jgi:predicted RNA-binding Zn-ribbon protein involved in translation (DUF1610 family)
VETGLSQKKERVKPREKPREKIEEKEEEMEEKIPQVEKTYHEEEVRSSSIEEQFEKSLKEQSPTAEEQEVIEVGKSSEHRRACPVCGNKKYIRELTDKNKIISISPRLYGKKFKCGECGAEWR